MSMQKIENDLIQRNCSIAISYENSLQLKEAGTHRLWMTLTHQSAGDCASIWAWLLGWAKPLLCSTKANAAKGAGLMWSLGWWKHMVAL
jgi:hypothetical protein